MNFAKYAVVACSGLMLFCTAACGSLLAPPTISKAAVYDWGYPAKVFDNVKKMVVINPFRMDGVSKFKMTFRTGPNTIVSDDSNLWASSPGTLLTNYLHLSFEKASGDYASRTVIDGAILMCQADLTKNEVIFSVLTRIRDFSKTAENQTYVDTFRVPLKEQTPEAFAAAMGIAAGQLAEKIRTRL